jgi:MFS family permease
MITFGRGLMGQAARVLRRVVPDIRPLRDNPSFRWLFAGQLTTQINRQMLVVAVPVQVYEHTGSTLLVGVAGLVQVLPVMVFSMVGGAAADAFDRRRLLVTVEVLLALTSVALGVNAASFSWVSLILVAVAANAALSSVESLVRATMIPGAVGPGQLTSALALNQSANQAAQFVGPACAGVLIAAFGTSVAYWTSAAAALLTGLLVLGMRSGDVVPSGRFHVSALREGWDYLRSTPVISHVLLIDLTAMVFGLPRALFPVIGTEVLHGDASTVGLLYAAPGAGALVAALTTGWVAHVRRQGRAVVLSVCTWGGAIIAFGLSRELWVAFLWLAVAGASDVISNVFRNTVIQEALPDAMRGRVTAYKTALSGGGPRLGDAEAGAVASATTVTFSVVSGGLLSIVGAVVIGVFGKQLWQQRSDHPTDSPRREAPS